jgi:hypothetical protein
MTDNEAWELWVAFAKLAATPEGEKYIYYEDGKRHIRDEAPDWLKEQTKEYLEKYNSGEIPRGTRP